PSLHTLAATLSSTPRLDDHLPIHAFPTRRSSDLLEDDSACPVCGSHEHPHPADPSEDAVSPEQVEAAEAARRAAEQAQAADAQADRKSTRLNSSHVKISYAVFCLKKKNPCEPVHD